MCHTNLPLCTEKFIVYLFILEIQMHCYISILKTGIMVFILYYITYFRPKTSGMGKVLRSDDFATCKCKKNMKISYFCFIFSTLCCIIVAEISIKIADLK